MISCEMSQYCHSLSMTLSLMVLRLSVVRPLAQLTLGGTAH